MKSYESGDCVWIDDLALSRWRPLLYRNQSKSMDWFLYDNGLRLEKVNDNNHTSFHLQ